MFLKCNCELITLNSHVACLRHCCRELCNHDYELLVLSTKSNPKLDCDFSDQFVSMSRQSKSYRRSKALVICPHSILFCFFCLAVHHDMCLQRRRSTLEKQHQQAENFLEKIREKKLRDLERWKLKHARMRERHRYQVSLGWEGTGGSESPALCTFYTSFPPLSIVVPSSLSKYSEILRSFLDFSRFPPP